MLQAASGRCCERHFEANKNLYCGHEGKGATRKPLVLVVAVCGSRARVMSVVVRPRGPRRCADNTDAWMIMMMVMMRLR